MKKKEINNFFLLLIYLFIIIIAPYFSPCTCRGVLAKRKNSVTLINSVINCFCQNLFSEFFFQNFLFYIFSKVFGSKFCFSTILFFSQLYCTIILIQLYENWLSIIKFACTRHCTHTNATFSTEIEKKVDLADEKRSTQWKSVTFLPCSIIYTINFFIQKVHPKYFVPLNTKMLLIRLLIIFIKTCKKLIMFPSFQRSFFNYLRIFLVYQANNWHFHDESGPVARQRSFISLKQFKFFKSDMVHCIVLRKWICLQFNTWYLFYLIT